MNVSTKYNVNDVVYYLGSCRKISKVKIQNISILTNKDRFVIYYCLSDGTPSIEESKLYSSAFEVYNYLNSIILKEVEKLQ